MRLKTLGLFVIVVVAAACASGGVAPASTSPSKPTAQRDRNVITMDELRDPALVGQTILDAIKTLRPNFLSSRGTQTIAYQGNNGVVDEESGKVHASIDDSGVLPLEDLKRIPVGSVVEVRLLSPAAAMQRFGGSAKTGAVIVVRTM